MELKAESGHNMLSENHALGIRIGSVCCALRCRDDKEYQKLHQLYHDFLTEEPADIVIDLEVTDHLNPRDLDEVFSETMFSHEGGRFWTNSRIVTGQYDLANRIIKITAERSLGNPELEFNHLNRLITMAYYSGCKVKYNGSSPPALLVHACGILRYGKAIVFAGPSGAGKTSIAHLCDKRRGQIINDEMVMISRPISGSNGITAQGVPVIGGVSSHGNMSAPLRCILLLKRSGRTSINYLDKAEAYLRFIRQVITPAHIGQRSGREVYSLMADFSTELVKSIPIYELEFNLDKITLWQAVSELEGI